jgi:hypothetical protein
MTGTIIVRSLSNQAGHQIGFEVYDYEAEVVLATFKNRDFGGVSFWRRAKAAAEAFITDLRFS